MKRLSLVLVCALFFTGFLTACGSDSGSDGPPPVLEGFFIDSAVEGLEYYGDDGVRKTTGAGGKFTYNAGDSVTFAIGGVILGQKTTGKAIITPLDLVPGADDPDSAARQMALRIVSFLLSFDDDGDPAANGITITADVRKAMEANTITDFTTVTDEMVNTWLAEQYPGRVMTSSTTAAAHLDDSLFALYRGDYKGTFETDTRDWGYFEVSVSSTGTLTGTYTSMGGGRGSIAGTIESGGKMTLYVDGKSGTGQLNVATGAFDVTINEFGSRYGWLKLEGTKD